MPGGELDALHAVELDDDALTALKLGGGPYLLLESAQPGARPVVPAAARSLARRGHHILLAHPERSPAFLKRPEALAELVAEGMLAQVTAGRSPVASDAPSRSPTRCSTAVSARRRSDGHGPIRQATIAAELGPGSTPTSPTG